ILISLAEQTFSALSKVCFPGSRYSTGLCSKGSVRMDLRHLRYVLVLAEELHFGKAAERLNTSQPPLSRYIRDVEQQLGVRLFYRTKRVVELTDAGARFVEEARRLVAQFDNLTTVASRAHNGEIGHLTVGCVTSYNRYLVQCVQAFSQQYPDVRLEFHSMGS